MGLKVMNIMAIFMFLLLAATANAQPRTIFDVTSATYGGKPNCDITDALAHAWRDACASPWPSRLVVPSGTYRLRGANFKGPCNAPIEVQIQGTLQAPEDGHQLVNSDSWVAFQYIDRLFLTGGGTFDGSQGRNNYRAINVRFDFVTNSAIQDITSLDSSGFHFNVFMCHDLTFQRLTIQAPKKSSNTDGIHIARSWRINVTDTDIGTGDDCISIGDGTKKLIVTNVNCGPGHGISVGSLGKYSDEQPVYGLVVRNCTFTNTTNGVRIKTWPGSPVTGLASHIHFVDITMNNVQNPIIIDQNYCPGHTCNQQGQSNIKISNIRFRNIRGTSASQVAVNLACSQTLPCEMVELIGIDLAYSGEHNRPILSQCTNVVNPTIVNVRDALACKVQTTELD
ncbi:PREDICTED: polygalacturonase-like [Fragaria vesca subsp. vesca]|uniref:polygalacturonase-like n=1 Tax=Fragaria vesca subsp. vesca TaxID=101020 RepID=UPI0002C34C85|nr:PREDICTED: polygalacturonase-like [Fragaria vesca subsp. vesca]